MREYELKRSRRRTAALEITREGTLLVRAPMTMPRAAIDDFVTRHEDWIGEHLRRRQENPPPPLPTAEETAELKRRAREVIPGRVEHYARLMGLAPAGVRVTAARTRYGSCSGKNVLCFSCYLMNAPAEAIDLVVVHELCHIVHKNHGPGFYALLGSVLPDHRQRKALLRGVMP